MVNEAAAPRIPTASKASRIASSWVVLKPCAVAALAAAGHDAALFPGSWSQWSSDPALPVARGDE